MLIDLANHSARSAQDAGFDGLKIFAITSLAGILTNDPLLLTTGVFAGFVGHTNLDQGKALHQVFADLSPRRPELAQWTLQQKAHSGHRSAAIAYICYAPSAISMTASAPDLPYLGSGLLVAFAVLAVMQSRLKHNVKMATQLYAAHNAPKPQRPQ